MRWKLIVITSLAAALLSCIVWCGLTIAIFGSARALARRDWLLAGSLIIPAGFTAFAAIFVYRHTAHKRKTQALITMVLSLLFAPLSYFGAQILLPERLCIPTYEVRHAR